MAGLAHTVLRRALIVVAAAALLPACDKLKGAIGKGDAGASSGGGVFSFLGSDFEGEITANITAKSKAQKAPQQVVFGIKKPKYRIDTTGIADNPQFAQGGAFIIDPPLKKGYMLVHQQKMAIVIDFEKLKNLPHGQPIPGIGTPKAAPPSQPPKIDKTGKKDTVAGYTCDIWNITSDNKKAELCVAEGITWIDLGDLGITSPELAAAVLTTELNHFPLRVITFDVKGAEEFRMEASKVDKKKLDDTRFVVPADYRLVDMAAMLGGLGGAPGAVPSGLPPNFPKHH